jgi:PAS domain S-box-containing protein
MAHTGIDPATIRGRLATEAFPDRDPWYIETYAHVVDSGESVLEEHYFEHVDRWLRMNVFPRGGDRFAVLYSDITDRKRVETVLRENEQRQAFLLRFSDAIRSEPNEQAAIERAVRMLAEEMFVDRAYATRHSPAEDLTNVLYEVRAPGLEPLPATLRFSDFPEAGRQTFQQTLVYQDTANDQSLTDADKAALASMGVGALLSRPLRRDGSPIFALGVVSTAPRRWTAAEIALVEEAAERTWEAAERARAERSLRESEEKYAGLFAASPAAVLILGPDTPHFTILDVNDAYLAATMRTREDLLGRAMFDAFPDNPDDPAPNGVRNLRTSLERALASRRFELMDVQKYDIVRPDGTFEERWWKPANAPVVDVNGNVAAIIHHVADVTAERRAVEALRESEERFREFGEASTDVLWMRSAESLEWTYLSRGFERIYGMDREEALSGDTMRNWIELVVPEDREHALECIGRVREGERATFEYRIRRPSDGQVRWVRNTDFPMRDASGKVIRIGGVGTDITPLKAAEAHQATLLAELQHRVRNTLAVVRSIARRTADNSKSVEDMVSHFQGRLDAFSRVQAAFTRAPGTGVDLMSIVEDELVAHAAREGEQVHVAGPDVILPMRTAEGLSLAIHELATNAVKHGALSGANGTLAIAWRVDKPDGVRRLVLTWIESGVDVPQSAVRREGFGMELLRRSLPYDLQAETDVTLSADGLRFELRMPLPAVNG